MSRKFSGNGTDGTGSPRKQKVRPQCWQRKCVCRSSRPLCSSSPQRHSGGQSAYFCMPVPSSMQCTRWCERKSVSVRNMLDLSTVPRRASRSLSDRVHSAVFNAESTNRRTAVGFICRCSSISVSDVSMVVNVILLNVAKLRKTIFNLLEKWFFLRQKNNGFGRESVRSR